MRPLSSSFATPPARAEVRAGVWLDSRLAVWFEPLRLLAVADIHWGYAASHRARGNLVPWWGDDEIEQRLLSLMRDYRPAEMLWLGDVVHAAEGRERAEKFLAGSSVPLVLLSGNHDRRWRVKREATVERGGFFFHHGDVTHPVPPGLTEVIGHHHPAVGWSDGAGTRLKLPALLASPRRLVLPAFSPWAEGTVWNHLLAADERLWAATPARVFPVRRLPAEQASA